MIRQSRNTDQWFLKDKPQTSHTLTALQSNIQKTQDNFQKSHLGPGAYDIQLQQSDMSKTISFNFGKIPFGSQESRFKRDIYWKPGPGQYEVDQQNYTKPDLLEISNKKQKNNSPQDIEEQNFLKTYKKQAMTSVFKSKEPKISLYQDMEKREQQLSGQKQQSNKKKYQIKLNDEIIDAESIQRERQMFTVKGQVKKGMAFKDKVSTSQVLDSIIKKNNLTNGSSTLRADTSYSRMPEINKKLTLAQEMGPGYYKIKDEILHKNIPQISIAQTG